MVRRNNRLESLMAEKKEVGIGSILSDIYEAIREIRYGSVQIHIQDGKVIQIDKLSKSRIQ